MRYFSVLLVCVWPLLGLAFDGDLECWNAHTQTDLNACAKITWEKSDETLHAAYNTALDQAAELDKQSNLKGADSHAALLIRAQSSWITYRDDVCNSEGQRWRGGSAQPMMFWVCMTRLTHARMIDLMAFGAEN